MFVLLSPIMFVLLFGYVFGNSIDIPGASYREFLIAGIFAQTVLFGATFTGAGIAEDMQKGIIDRFRSLPMSRAAVLAGRTASDVIYNVLSIAIMAVTGLAVGWRIRGSFLEAIAGFALLLLFAYAISWVMALVALLVPSAEVINNASFMVIFPLTFVANTFVPAEDLPGPLRTSPSGTRCRRSPRRRASCSATSPPARPSRRLVAAEPGALHAALGGRHVAVFAPLSVRRYQRASPR